MVAAPATEHLFQTVAMCSVFVGITAYVATRFGLDALHMYRMRAGGGCVSCGHPKSAAMDAVRCPECGFPRSWFVLRYVASRSYLPTGMLPNGRACSMASPRLLVDLPMARLTPAGRLLWFVLLVAVIASLLVIVMIEMPPWLAAMIPWLTLAAAIAVLPALPETARMKRFESRLFGGKSTANG
ncbi:MAG: hypothetical protein AAF747_09515 [Planctomycetota bacterium]